MCVTFMFCMLNAVQSQSGVIHVLSYMVLYMLGKLSAEASSEVGYDGYKPKSGHMQVRRRLQEQRGLHSQDHLRTCMCTDLVLYP